MSDLLLWLDVETTGLDPSEDWIVEVGCLLTTLDGHEVGESFEVVVAADEVITARLDSPEGRYARDMHARSGLLDAMASPDALPWPDALTALRDWVHDHARRAHLAGFSVHFDRSFLQHHAPKVLRALHHRQLDVTSLELARRAAGFGPLRTPGKPAHRSMDDCRAALRVYRHWLERCQQAEAAADLTPEADPEPEPAHASLELCSEGC